MNASQLQDFATRYTTAWCSQNAVSVAAFYAESGSLQINNGAPAVGRAAITAAAQSFMSEFPDLLITLDGAELLGNRAIYRWTLAGTSTGPGGTGNRVRISGYEEWTMSPGGLVADSKGHYDAVDYQRQLRGGGSGYKK